MTAELERVALHESGHAFVAWRLGRTPRGLSCVPGRSWAGTSHYGVARVPDRSWNRLDPSQPLALWPAAARRAFETRAMISAAGDVAEALLWWPAQGDSVRTPDPLVTQVADAHPTTDAERARLAAAAGDTGMTDAENLWRIADALYPDDFGTRAAWLAWVDAEAKAIVADGANRIQRLAAVALDRGRLSGRAVRAVLESS